VRHPVLVALVLSLLLLTVLVVGVAAGARCRRACQAGLDHVLLLVLRVLASAVTLVLPCIINDISIMLLATILNIYIYISDGGLN
jgi:hypothetical protein